MSGNPAQSNSQYEHCDDYLFANVILYCTHTQIHRQSYRQKKTEVREVCTFFPFGRIPRSGRMAAKECKLPTMCFTCAAGGSRFNGICPVNALLEEGND